MCNCLHTMYLHYGGRCYGVDAAHAPCRCARYDGNGLLLTPLSPDPIWQAAVDGRAARDAHAAEQRILAKLLQRSTV